MGDNGAGRTFDAVYALAYDELRAIAHRHLRRQRRLGAPPTTVGTTALVNEAYLKLVSRSADLATNRNHFLAVASVAMRHILIDRAKLRRAEKRGGGARAVSLNDEALTIDNDPSTLLEINEALDRVAALDARLARVVECRFFGGLSEEETADVMGVTVRTIRRDWVKARALLHHELAS